VRLPPAAITCQLGDHSTRPACSRVHAATTILSQPFVL
jgi:hypothetical protein